MFLERSATFEQSADLEEQSADLEAEGNQGPNYSGGSTIKLFKFCIRFACN